MAFRNSPKGHAIYHFRICIQLFVVFQDSSHTVDDALVDRLLNGLSAFI